MAPEGLIMHSQAQTSAPIQSQISPLNACVVPNNQSKALWNVS